MQSPADILVPCAYRQSTAHNPVHRRKRASYLNTVGLHGACLSTQTPCVCCRESAKEGFFLELHPRLQRHYVDLALDASTVIIGLINTNRLFCIGLCFSTQVCICRDCAVRNSRIQLKTQRLVDILRCRRRYCASVPSRWRHKRAQPRRFAPHFYVLAGIVRLLSLW